MSERPHILRNGFDEEKKQQRLDLFAAHALQGLLAQPLQDGMTIEDAVLLSAHYAREMIAALDTES